VVTADGDGLDAIGALHPAAPIAKAARRRADPALASDRVG